MRSIGSSDQEIRSGSGSSSSVIEYAKGIGNFADKPRDTSNPRFSWNQDKNNYWKNILIASYLSVGVIFGDIGTSPIYAYRVIFTILDHSRATIYGVTSLIIWSFVFIVIIKYLAIMVSADDNGEGGSFAIYSIICRHLRLNASGEEPSFHDELDRQLTTYSNYESKRDSINGDSLLRRSKIAQNLLLLLTLMSASLILGDGVLTPAVSVLSSVEGLAVEVESLSGLVLPLTCILMFAVFVIQSFGTHRLSSTFSPTVTIWLLGNAAIGLYNIINYDPYILQAISPHYAARVLLCITGAEALFADMGHFSKASIRLATSAFVLPCLTITYMGQAAYIFRYPASAANPFWLSVPKAVYWPVFALSVMVTVIASQVHQAVAINCFPPIHICHTSKKVYGQIYAPSFNYILMILSMGTVLLFRTSDRIVSAYGVAVSIVMTLSTISVSIVVHKVWELHWSITAIFLIVYAFIDGSYLTSNLLKAQSWGWYTIIISVVLVSLMVTWRWGKLLTLKASKKKSRTAKHLYKGLLEKRHDFSDGNQDYTVHNWNTFNNLGEIRKYSSTIGKGHTEKNRNVMLNKHYMQRTDNGAEEYQGLVKIPGACVFYTNQHGNVPPVFYQYLETFPAVFSVTAFLHIRRAIVPYVVSHERLRVMELRYEGFYSVVATFGYMDAIEPGEKLASEIFAGLRHLEIVNCRDEIEYNAMMENAEKRPPSVSAQTGHAATSDVDPIIPVGSQPKDSDIFERSNVPLPYEIEFEVAPGVKAGRAEDSTAADHQNIRDNSRVFYGSTTKTADPVYSGAKRDPLTHLNIRINQLAHAYSTGVTYIISESHLFADKGKKWAIFPGLRRYLIETVFNFMNFMTVSATTLHDIPLNRSVVLSAKLEG